jgi:enoyl-CoA hydratase/carnithine racemase
MELVREDRRDGVARLTLCRGVTNPLSLELLRELAGCLELAMLDEDVRALVLSSESDKFFSIGFDLPRLIELDREGFTAYYRTFNRLSMDLYVFPKPTVAAITGHAIAGGCILALCCDERYIASGRKLMGLNEVKLGVPVPYPGDCILRQVVGSRTAREIMEGGEFFPADDLLEMGMVDRVTPQEEVEPASVERAVALGSFPSDAFSVIKRNRTALVEAEVEAHVEEDERTFLDCWFSEGTRRLLAEAAEKF